MAQRYLEIMLHQDQKERAIGLLADRSLEYWMVPLEQQRILFKVLLQTEDSESLLDLFSAQFTELDGFRVVIQTIEATLPRIKEEEKEPEADPHRIESTKRKIMRVSREELYTAVEKGAKLNRIYLILVILSSIVAAIGLMKNNVAVIIGAMVIAPLLGPNIALSLSTVLGDRDLAKQALLAKGIGMITAFLFALGVGFLFTVKVFGFGPIFPITPMIPEIAARTSVGLSDVILALASGVAGTLAFTTGVSSSLIGVMVAVALLPPLVTCGMLLGAGYPSPAMGALLMLFTNVICVNIAADVTFVAQGITPRTWWESTKAKKATQRAVIALLMLLVIAISLIVLAKLK